MLDDHRNSACRRRRRWRQYSQVYTQRFAHTCTALHGVHKMHLMLNDSSSVKLRLLVTVQVAGHINYEQVRLYCISIGSIVPQ
jgi:hypothetical protein